VSVIRASDIGTYLYCRRAWWYRKQGFESENQAELVAGSGLHREHGRRVLAAGLTRVVGFFMLMLALVLLVSYCTARIL
jgi:CRISPR/Cas system-associated exonuclease Cas4 (RecB family)